MVRHLLDLSQEVPNQLWPLNDNVHQVPRNFAGKRQENIRVFPKLLGQFSNDVLRRWSEIPPFNLAEIGRFNADPAGDLSERKAPIILEKLFATLPYICSEFVHV